MGAFDDLNNSQSSGGAFADLGRPNKNKVDGANAPGALRGFLSVLNGPTLGFGDELAGAVGGAYDTVFKGGSFSDNYQGNRDFARGAQEAEKQNSPWTTGITQGMASAPLAAIKVLQGARFAPEITGLAGNTLRAAASGFGFGSVQGVGNSEEETLYGNLKDGGVGGVVGAATGAVMQPAISAVGAVGSNVAQRWNGNSANNAARAKIAEAFARDARGETFTSGASNPALQAATRFNRLGNEAVVADAGGENVKQLLDTLAILPGRTKVGANTLIHDRQAGRAGRLIGAAEDSLGTTGQRLTPHLTQWAEDRATASAPLYNQVRQINVDPSDELRSIISAADDLGGLNEARAIATANRTQFGISPSNPQSWNLGQLDQVKQGLDQLLTSRRALNADGTFTPFGGSVQGLKRSLLKELDSVTTDPQTQQSVYRQARDAFAGPSAIIDAANKGRAALSKDGAAISQLTADLTDSEMQAFRLGAFESLRTKMGKEGGQTEILKMWKEPATREKLKEVFGDEVRFRSFAANVAKESRLKGLETVGRGSQTTGRQFAAGDLDNGPGVGDAVDAVANAKTGNLLGLLGTAQQAWNKVSMPETTRDQMGRLLLSRGQQGATNLNSMRDLIEEINKRNQTFSQGTGLIGSQLGTSMPTGLLGY